MRTLATAAEKFWSFVDIKSENSCWEWTSLRRPGKWNYGRFWVDGRIHRAHRIAYALHQGKHVPKGLLVCHRCDNPPCCNPNHLFVGTDKDNLVDMSRKGRSPNPRSCLGLFGQEHPAHKLTKTDVETIRKLYATGEHFYQDLAERFNVSIGTIKNVALGRHYPDASFVPVRFSPRWHKRLDQIVDRT